MRVAGLRGVAVLLLVLAVASAQAAVCTSRQAGNWSAANRWNCDAGTSNGPPAAGDSAVVAHAIALDANTNTLAGLTVNTGASIVSNSNNRVINLNGPLVNNGTITIIQGTTGRIVLAGDSTWSGSGTVSLEYVDQTWHTLDFAVGSTLTIQLADASPIRQSGGFNLATPSNTVTLWLNGTAQTISPDSISYPNLRVSGGTKSSSGGALIILGDLTIDAGATFSSINNVSLGGNLTRNGTLSPADGAWVFNGAITQTISAATTFRRVTLNNAQGLVLGGSMTIGDASWGDLTLTAGHIVTGAYSVVIPRSCDAPWRFFNSGSWINGNLRLTYPASNVTCVYPVGDTVYAPITVTIPHFTGIAGGSLTGSTAGSEYPQVVTSGIDTYLDVNRYWTLGTSGDTMATLPSAGSYSVSLGFDAADVDAGATVSSFKVGKYASSAWSALAGSASGTTATLTGQTNFGSFAVGTPLLPVSLAKTASSAAAAVNSYVTFTLSVTNTNATDLSNVVLTDVIPTGMTYQANAATSGTATVSGQTLTWLIPSLVAGANAQLTLVVQPTLQGTFTNTVTAGLKSASATILILPNSYVNYRMDEAVGTWTSTVTPGTVIDSGINALNGHLRTTATPTTTNAVSPSPTIASQQGSVVGGFCNAGNFDGRAVVETPASTFFQFTQKMSASAWIYPRGLTYTPSGGDLSSIMSNDTNYEFHLDATGHLFWWWNASSMTSASTIPLNQWTHVAITMDSSLGAASRERIYINGVADTNTNNWSGTLQANACPFYIGGDITTGAGCALIPGRNFQGMIDEAKIYNYELSPAEVQADMTLGRQCGATFDHIRIEHDGTASTCTPKTVTLKACLNASCTALYPGPVQVTLTPSGWTSGNTVTITNGVTTATLNNSSISAPTLTLGGTAYGSTLPTNTTARCFNGTNETCALSVASTACNFDAVEVGANPKTNLYTKLASTPFNVDILALSNSTTINTAYTGTVTVDLVDTSASACSSTSAVLSTAQPTFSFVGTDKGRRSVTLTAKATPSAQVRIKSGSAYACSYDKLAVRPTGFAVSSNANADATGTSVAATPVFGAGADFTLTADSGALGYNAVPKLDLTKIAAHAGAVQAGTLAGIFSAADPLTGRAAGTAFTYSDVGYFRLAANGVYDDTFAIVDSAVGDCTADFSNASPGGKFGCKFGNTAATNYFGRFIPDHFAVTAGVIVPACSNTFSYFAQDGFTTPFALTAQNLTNGTTRNYVANFAKLVLTNYASYGFSAAPLPAGSLLASSAVAPTGAWINGVASNVSARHQISRPAALAGQTAIIVSAAPTDGEVPAGVAAAVGGASNFRYGRLWLGNAYGSERSALAMPYETQFWNGLAFVRNVDDNCTSLVAANFGIGNYQRPAFAPSLPAPSIAPGAFAAGSGSVTLAAPNAAGSADVVIRLNPALSMCPAWAPQYPVGTPTTVDHLRGQWCGAAPDRDPVARATFGISKSNRQIYLREGF